MPYYYHFTPDRLNGRAVFYCPEKEILMNQNNQKKTMKMKKRMKTKPRILRLFLFLLGCLLAAGQTWAQTQPAGAGTQDNPYQIGTVDELLWFANHVNSGNASACAELTTDITIPEGQMWTPIGKHKKEYTGTFDGHGHTIEGLMINVIADYQGFVGYLKGGTIRDLTLGTSCSVTIGVNNSYLGGVCGYNESGTIENCTNNGTVSGGLDTVGGVCGINYGTIENCTNNGTVSCGYDGMRSDCKEGGVCGVNYGTLTGCTNNGTVSGFYDTVGGVCGKNRGTIENCTNSGTVSGTVYLGGVCGYNENGTITNCTNTGAVYGTVGSNQVGGVCGVNNVTITNCYWLDTAYSVGVGRNTSTGTATDVEQKTASEFASGEVAYLLNGSSSDSPVWYQNLGEGGDPYPVPDSSHGIVYAEQYCDGATTGNYSNSKIIIHANYENGFCTLCGTYQSADLNGDVYEISNAGQLFWFAALVNGTLEGTAQNAAASAVLTTNIDLSDKAWTPIGNASTIYNGTFDGQNHTISGMKIENAESYSGLFGNVTGTVKNFTVNGSITITGSESVSKVGGAVGSLGTASAVGTVSGVTSDVDITVSAGNDHIGGVVGSMPENSSPTVQNCVYTGDINITVAAGSVAGIVGYIRTGTIQNCANQGGISVSGSGDGSVGGILGYCNNSKIYIRNCYNSGGISAEGTANVGAIVGNNRDDNNHVGQATVTNCYYLAGSAAKGQGQLGTDATGTVVKSAEKFKSGEVAYLLQGDQTELAWGQAIGTDEYPVLTTDEAKKVYAYSIYKGNSTAEPGYANSGAVIGLEGNAVAVVETAGFTVADGNANVIVKDGGAYTCGSLVLTDGADFYTPVAFTATEATYSRTLPSTSTWGTIALPFAVAEVSGASLYQADGVVSDSGEESILAVVPAGGNTLDANTPALFKGEGEGAEVSFSASGAEVAATADAVLTKAIGESSYNLNGSMSTITLDEGDLFISKDKFWSVGTQNTVGMQAFRAYIDAPSSSPAKSMRIMVGSTSDIRQAVSGGSRLVDVYSLQGIMLRKGVESGKALNGLPSGVYVVDGKKVMF